MSLSLAATGKKTSRVGIASSDAMPASAQRKQNVIVNISQWNNDVDVDDDQPSRHQSAAATSSAAAARPAGPKPRGPSTALAAKAPSRAASDVQGPTGEYMATDGHAVAVDVDVGNDADVPYELQDLPPAPRHDAHGERGGGHELRGLLHDDDEDA